jgi:regulator of RNase E activity RraA
MQSIGFRVITKITRADEAAVARLRGVATGDLADAMRGSYVMDGAIRPVYEPMEPMVGTAVTVSIPRADHMYLFKLGAEQTRRGDVLVVNARGDVTCGLTGGNLCRGFRARGLAGVIVDGGIRDVEETRETGLPVYARGVTPVGDSVYGPGEVNIPIACGGVVVHPGDIIVGDRDGVAVVPRTAVDEILAFIKELKARHASMQPALARGEVTNIASITHQLVAMGCRID